ncbi:hypothetical protein AVEN_147129-1 [Araneus ventricosus]|uniref:Uncharacterized protein n=1 Tax=Araneus ventricosus TaxID=182803 RepID=A0A4Y2GFX9_ARAVE|nr:hypothetical protein AVEN_147129-1 [Araneus ventricosus]
MAILTLEIKKRGCKVDHKKGKFSMIRLVCFGNKLGTFPPNKDEHAELAHELLVVLRQFPKRRAALQL